MILGGWQSRHTSDLGLASTKAHSAKALFVKSSSIWSHTSKGFLIVFLNPKIALFFFAVFSQFLHVGQHQILQWTMASLAGVIDALWYLAIAILVSIPSVSNVLNRFGWQLDILWGSVIVAIAAALMINLSSTGL